MLNENKIEQNKREIISLLLGTKRAGMEEVIRYLECSGFFTAPSSVSRHHNWRGGLSEHSLGVFHKALELEEGLPKDSLIITGLLHDVCKASKLYVDSHGVFHERHTHIKGHGYRSVRLLEKCGLELMDEEKKTIRWHMGGHHASAQEQEEVRNTRDLRLWQVIHLADILDAKYGSTCAKDKFKNR